MPPEITRLVDQFLRDPTRIEVARPATTAKSITQRFVYCSNGEDWAKREMLRDLIRDGNVKNAIIFCNRKRDVAVLFKSLSKHGFNAGELHGDMDQTSRTETLDKFRNGEIMLLAASDVAARGLDIPDVSHVFNFDLPWAADDYVHRIGRTGRAGREGYSASLVSPDDLKFVADIEKVTGETAVWLGDPPSEEDIAGAGKRRRGRGGRGAPAGKSARPRSGRGEARGAGPKKANGAVVQHAEPEGRSERQPAQLSPVPQRAKREHPRDDEPATPRTRSPKAAPRQRAADSWTDEPKKAPRRSPSSGERAPAVAEQARKPQPAQKADERVGFAENIPAFMRRPARPVKVPGRG
jgi:superfamily II DNA/RNA helicase